MTIVFSKKILKIIVSLLIASAILYFHSINNYLKTKTYSHSENGYTFTYKYKPYGFVDSLITIPITIDGIDSSQVKVIFRKSKLGLDDNSNLWQYRTVDMFLDDYQNGFYYTSFNLALKGNPIFYYFEIQNKIGKKIATFMNDNGKPFKLITIGHPPAVFLYGKMISLLLAFFFIAMISVHSLNLPQNIKIRDTIAVYILLALLFIILGGVILASLVNNYTFGKSWGAFPFGNDTGNNKMQLIALYLLLLFLLNLKSITKAKLFRNLYSANVIRFLGIGLLIFTALLSIPIPQSIKSRMSL